MLTEANRNKVVLFVFVPLFSNILVNFCFKFVAYFGSNAFVGIKDRGRARDKALGSIRRVE